MNEVAIKLTVGAVTAASSVFNPDITVPYVGVPVNVLVAACGGAISGFAFANKEEDRKQLFFVAFACVVVGCALTALIVGLFEWKFNVQVKPPLVSAVAVVVAFMARWVLPAIIERVGPWLDKIPFLRKPPKGE